MLNRSAARRHHDPEDVITATIRDVAAAAGVSPATVSRAFGRPEKVDESTRRRIVEAAERLGYQPNRAAQSLTTGRTGNIGIMVPDLANPFFTSVLKGAQHQANRLGHPVLLADTEEDPSAELRFSRALAQQVDGLVLCGSLMSDDEVLQISRLRPLVLVNRQVPKLPAITVDNAGGARQAVTHLRALGHRRIGYVAGPPGSYSNAERYQAVSEHAEGAGLECVPVGHFEPSFEGGRGAADQVLLAGVSAVVVYNDVMALGLVNQLVAYGVAVPAEISVVGFDDIPIAAMFTPALTTVRIPREQAGGAAVAHLHALLTGGRPVPPPDLTTELVVRGTTARSR
ncbi:LacI family DNA-binding transcriptional regulator [Kineosporia sp. J2-2]|uniref:LacI family DNA-binding transcriptional regulator n=1 Tax=Kineosporia corallincola TaxID=2835133 RepID=A0ABS5TRC0_9ACTN|nr:LacI family DNA-binding transcriptional regulator [Kineosporia corallincola]MBT0773350.1 LacI family DNA-binding transcriptional regulator [Kineosporia corallincola]